MRRHEPQDAHADAQDTSPLVRDLVARLLSAAVDSSGGGDQAFCFPSLSDTRIADEPDGASTKGKPMRRVHGPYRHHDRWRIKIVERRTGAVTHQSFSTEEEARAAVRCLRRRLAWETGVSVADALKDYEKHLALKGNKPRTVLTTMYRLRRFFGSVGKLAVVGLTPATGQRLYDDFTQGETKRGQTMSVDSARNTLAEAKTFLGWAVTKRWARANALAEVKGVGKRRRGKPQLTVDEARRWLAVGMEMAAKEDGVVAALMALLMGMRASEIADRIVRNLDDEGRLLWITDAKTQAGIRRLRVPESLQPLLRRIAQGKQPTDRLFGARANRQTVLRHVRRICKATGVPTVSPHGLRGTHASLAMTAGATGDLVASALGHESFTTTERHYAKPEAVAAAQQVGALRELERNLRPFPRAA
ncbi:MAG TPA: site-specific integrase [Polyangia bacterium]|nr:site-specific integrase [Polyangia bacterium]